MTEQERDQLARKTAERIVDYINADADPEEGSWGVQGIARIVRKTIDQTLLRALAVAPKEETR